MLGAGGISNHHVNGLLGNPDKIECVALCDVSDENMRERSEQLGGGQLQYRDWKKMFAEIGDQIDAVDICLPHHLHGAAIFDALKAKKHILCEKPMCIDLEEAANIVAGVKDAGVTYMSAHNQLFFPAVQEAKRMLDSGMIGKLRWIRSQDCHHIRGMFGGTWRSNLKSQGGGVLIDTGYHPTYRLLYFADAKIEAVRGTYSRFGQNIDGEDTASVQVRFENGVIGEIFTSWVMSNPHNTHQIHLVGDKGQIFGSDDILYYLPNGFKEPARFEVSSNGSAFAKSFELQMAHFAECIREKKRPIHGAEEGYSALEIILKSSRDAEGWQETAPMKL